MSEVIRIPEPGDTVGGQFQLETEIGRGGFGIVYRARQLGIERYVAVKMLMPHALTHDGVVERFKREARLASSLTHPNSVTIYAYGVHSENESDRGLPYIAMEYLQGQTLHEYLYDRGQLSLDETVSILKQSLGSLAEAHRRCFIHR
ncbi:MAG: serine/threonine-protein kinase, partial [Myxococcota bacterium]